MIPLQFCRVESTILLPWRSARLLFTSISFMRRSMQRWRQRRRKGDVDEVARLIKLSLTNSHLNNDELGEFINSGDTGGVRYIFKVHTKAFEG